MKSKEIDASQYLTFLLGDEEYGINILSVQELRGWTPVSRLPDMPPHILGVLNLRGEIIPVVDLRRRFGMKPAECGPTTVVVVVRAKRQESDESIPVGLIVDAVSETHTITTEQIQPPPKIGVGVDSEHITGLFAFEEKMIILLDINELVMSDELSEISIPETV